MMVLDTACTYLVVSRPTEDHGDIWFALGGHCGLVALHKGGCLSARSVEESMRDLLKHAHLGPGFVGFPWHCVWLTPNMALVLYMVTAVKSKGPAAVHEYRCLFDISHEGLQKSKAWLYWNYSVPIQHAW